jgi:hypothetical protein
MILLAGGFGEHETNTNDSAPKMKTPSPILPVMNSNGMRRK